MDDWSDVQLDDVIAIKHGFAFKGEHFVEYPTDDVLVTPGNFAIGGGFRLGKIKSHDGPVPVGYVLSPGDVIVTMTDLSKQADTLGYSAVVPKLEYRFLHNQRIGKVILKDHSVDLAFIAWLMRTEGYRHQVVGSATGSTVKHTSPGRILSYRFKLPPSAEQRRISTVLSTLDDKIELNRRMNETLEASARALFRDWFVDFGPTRARAEGRPAWLAPDLWSLFPDRLGDDGVPEGWIADTLAAIAKLNPETWGGKDHPHQLRYVDLSNTKWGYVEKVEPYSWADAPSRARRVLRPGDTIIGTVRPGNGSYAYIGEPELTGSTGFAVLRPIVERDQAVVWCAATSSDNIVRLAHLADGGAYPAIRPEAVLSTEMPVPSPEILSAFAKMVMPLLEQIEANKIESRTLAATRDALLPKLMSGEIRVREAEALAA